MSCDLGFSDTRNLSDATKNAFDTVETSSAWSTCSLVLLRLPHDNMNTFLCLEHQAERDVQPDELRVQVPPVRAPPFSLEQQRRSRGSSERRESTNVSSHRTIFSPATW